MINTFLGVKMLQEEKKFFKNDVRPLLLPKQGPHIYKEGKEKQVRELPRTGKQEGRAAPQRDTALIMEKFAAGREV